MPIELTSLPLPPSVDANKFKEFGKEVKGVNPAKLSSAEFQEIENLLYKHDLLLFRDVTLNPEEQYALVKAFDPLSESYGHGNNQVDGAKQSILNALLKSIPRVPQVQLIGNGTVHDHEGIAEAKLTHAHHKTFHRTHISKEDEAKGFTRFYRWHMDAALYDLSPPKVTAFHALKVPQGDSQVVKYDDESGDELPLPLAPTAFISGSNAFDLLSPALKSLAVRSRVKYAPHPFVWMGPARAFSDGLGIESEGREVPLSELPQWEESKIKILPMLWKNPITGALHLQLNGCGVAEILVDAVPSDKNKNDVLYPDGIHIKDLVKVRRLLHEIQRPGITSSLVYPHDWREKDLIIFNNRGVLHSIVGSLKPHDLRVYHQCNLAASDDPKGPSAEDVQRFS